jgi:hypothetical protein
VFGGNSPAISGKAIEERLAGINSSAWQTS